jgi:class 3 adenylate cyclase
VTDRVLATLAGAVAEFGGSVDKLTGDGLMAVFGAPTAHEDDAERAVRAAARMQSAVRRVVQEESGGGRRLGLRVGLNTGEVVAGVQASLSYTVIGDTVNTAAGCRTPPGSAPSSPVARPPSPRCTPRPGGRSRRCASRASASR